MAESAPVTHYVGSKAKKAKSKAKPAAKPARSPKPVGKPKRSGRGR